MNYYSVTKKKILSFATVWMDPLGVHYGTGNKSDRERQILHDLICHCCSITQSCLNLCDPMDCSPPGSSVPAEFSRQEYWSGLPCPAPRGLPNPRPEPGCPALQADSSPAELPGKPKFAQSQLKYRI